MSSYEAKALLDLDKPSLLGLMYILRHKELWPAGFKWDYSRCESCAMGLAGALWQAQSGFISEEGYNPIFADCDYIDDLIYSMADTFGISQRQATGIFLEADTDNNDEIICKMELVTPEMIADKIEEILLDGLLTDTKHAELGV